MSDSSGDSGNLRTDTQTDIRQTDIHTNRHTYSVRVGSLRLQPALVRSETTKTTGQLKTTHARSYDSSTAACMCNGLARPASGRVQGTELWDFMDMLRRLISCRIIYLIYLSNLSNIL